MENNIYDKLEPFLNNCIKNGWQPYGDKKFGHIHAYSPFCRIHYKLLPHNVYKEISYHDLFSVESRLMQFILRKDNDQTLDIEFGTGTYENGQTHAMVMSWMNKEEAVQYFLENALLPTNEKNE